MLKLVLFFQTHGVDILQAFSGIISGASVLANFTKTDRDNRALGAISKAIHFLAANFFALGAGGDGKPPTYNR